MPSSTISLESLSSPSPSPSPPPQDTQTSTSNKSGGGAGLDSGSELSELTEDEQENEKRQTDREERARPSRRGRKRSGMIPPGMWDWAYKNNKKEPQKPKPEEEEEEEEQAGPAKAMEEEEDDEQDDRSHTGTSSVPDRRARRGIVRGAVVSDDEGPASGHNGPSGGPSKDSRAGNIDDADVLSEEEEGELAADGDDDDDAQPAEASGAASRDVTDDENAEDDEGGVPVEDDRPEDDDDVDENAVVGSEDEAGPSSAPISASAVSVGPPRQVVEPSAESEIGDVNMDVDESAPPTAQRSPIVAAAQASSIMAGSSIIRPPSPSPSVSSVEGSTRKRTPAESRSPSPEVASDREKRAPTRTRTRARNGRSTRNRNRRKPKQDVLTEAGNEIDQAAADERDLDIDEGDLDNAEIEESDLQPAHRAEALDVLATIELKYALLRERLYVEKMENLAWEEALVLEGTHPEMLHLQAELSKRRDKRLELATRRRDYEIVNITKRRRLDEDAVWSWWKYRRDDLQTTMVAETNRKRRRLDRERRALDRPPPVRTIPTLPTEVPPAPSLREVVRNDPFSSPEARRRQLPLSSLAYPQLTTLSPMDIVNDLEYLNQHRRAYDSTRSGVMGMNHMGHPAPGVPPYDQYNMGMNIIDGSGMPSRLPPQMQFQQPLQSQIVPSYPGGPRLQHHHSAPSGSIPNLPHSQMLIEHDVGPIRRPGSGAPPVPPFPSSSSALTRRSISPVPLQSHGVPHPSGSLLNNKPNGWLAGPGAPIPMALQPKEPLRMGGGARPIEPETLEREKDRDRLPAAAKAMERPEWEWDRERDRDRERERERDREVDHDRDRDREQERDIDTLDQNAQVLQPFQRAHQQVSPSQGSSRVAHHHRHHHHHVHHHHHPQQNSNTSGVSSSVLPNGGRSSPLMPREIDGRRGQADGAIDGVEQSASVKPSIASPMSVLWKSSEESADPSRDRGRSLLASALQERMPAAFGVVPTHPVSVHTSFPTSPRNAPGPSTAPASIASSRRGSWSAPDDGNLPRPSSAHSQVANNASGAPSHLHPSAGLAAKRLQQSPLMPPQSNSILMSPSHANGIKLPPLSPPTSSAPRSPLRGGQALPPLTSGAMSSKVPSPKVLRRSPPPSSRPKSPSREQSHAASGPVPGTQGSLRGRPTSPAPVFAISPPIPPLGGSRMSNPSGGTDPQLPPVPQSIPS